MNEFSSSICGTNNDGLAQGACDPTQYGRFLGMGALTAATKIPIASLTLPYMENLVKQRKLRQLTDLYDATMDNATNGTATSGLGVLIQTSQSKPSFGLVYTKGTCVHRGLYNMRGQGQWAWLWYFESGLGIWVDAAKENFVGLKSGMFSVDSWTPQIGDEPMKSTAMMQITDPDQYNTRFVFKTWNDLGFNLNDLQDVINVSIKYVGEVEAGATEIEFDVVSACSGTAISGLTAESGVLFTLGGTQATPATITAIAESTTVSGRYTATIDEALADNDTIQIGTSDGTYTVIEDIDGVLYSGTAAVETVGVTPSV